MFIPPLTPHWGGKHEACVKQIKALLVRTIGKTKLPYPALTTVLKQCEAAANSRPLCRVEGPAEERDVILTPASLMIGRNLNALPEEDYTTKCNLADRFQHQQRMVQTFWKHYSEMYLQQLMNLPKWTKPEENVSVGEIVLLREENTPPLVWRKARVS